MSSPPSDSTSGTTASGVDGHFRPVTSRFDSGVSQLGSPIDEKLKDGDKQGSGDRPTTGNSLIDGYLAGIRSDNSEGVSLAKGLIDYIRVVEERIEKLEKESPQSARLSRNQGINDRSQEELRTARASRLNNNPGEPHIQQHQSPKEILLRPGFFNLDSQFLFDAKGRFVDNTNKNNGSHQASPKPRYLIQVLYSWIDEIVAAPPKLADDESPNRDHIDAVAIGILSRPLAVFFDKQLGFETKWKRVLRIGKPFRPLLRNLNAIREQLNILEGKYGSVNTSPEEDDIEEYDRPEALEHFRCLVQFADHYLYKKIDFYQKLRAGIPNKISFEDLWMLFDSGDTLYCPSREGGQVLTGADATFTTRSRSIPQAYRIVATAGGIPLKRTLAPKNIAPDDFMEDPLFRFFMGPTKLKRQQSVNIQSQSSLTIKSTYSQLCVLCLYIDFDGVRYGTEADFITFKPFDGQVDIHSLEAYPIKYMPTSAVYTIAPTQKVENDEDPEVETRHKDKHVDKPKQDDFFLARGEKFIDVTAVSHMSYDGFTIGKNREEINSPVIVDFKLAFQEYLKSFTDNGADIPKFFPLSRLWPEMDADQTFEFFECDGPGVDGHGLGSCDAIYCNYITDLYDNFQIKRVEKVENRMKQLVEFETDTTDQRDGLDRFKKHMEENDLIRLLPGAVPGFALRNRKWILVDLSKLKHVKQEYNWKNLVLPKGHREIVQAMVESHSKGSSLTGHSSQGAKIEMDLVQGKGKGCIILLHGVPGVGKTSTAECVAAYTGRPLYPITCGDVGYTAETVEENMGKHFKLAHKWGCVLLLDEADVFLAKRNKSDIKRNGLVSVFLRILEYYSGILFLTTNRVGAIDDAFRSRLHLTLYYPKLTRNQVIKIWKTNLDRLEAINMERKEEGLALIKFDRKKIMNWVKKNHDSVQWNGRQIRNAMQTAIALAEFKDKKRSHRGPDEPPGPPVMSTSLFTLIANASIQFSEYLLATHGDDEDEVANRDQIRPANFSAKTRIVEISDGSDSEDSISESDGDSEKSSRSDSESSEESETESDRKKNKKNKKSKSKSKKGLSSKSGELAFKEEKEKNKGRNKRE